MAKPLVPFTEGHVEHGGQAYVEECMDVAGSDPVRLRITEAFQFSNVGNGGLSSTRAVQAEVRRTNQITDRHTWVPLSSIMVGPSYEDLLDLWARGFDKQYDRFRE